MVLVDPPIVVAANSRTPRYKPLRTYATGGRGLSGTGSVQYWTSSEARNSTQRVGDLPQNGDLMNPRASDRRSLFPLTPATYRSLPNPRLGQGGRRLMLPGRLASVRVGLRDGVGAGGECADAVDNDPGRCARIDLHHDRLVHRRRLAGASVDQITPHGCRHERGIGHGSSPREVHRRGVRRSGRQPSSSAAPNQGAPRQPPPSAAVDGATTGALDLAAPPRSRVSRTTGVPGSLRVVSTARRGPSSPRTCPG